ncbi:MAG: hypothetical protein ACRD8O_03360 [Bryobacteraceae bacterium]
MTSPAIRATLVNALCGIVCESRKRRTRQFLLGLSADELQYIAEFLGSCILEEQHPGQWNRTRLASAIQRFEESRGAGSRGREHRMIVLLEYFRRSHEAPLAAAARASNV